MAFPHNPIGWLEIPVTDMERAEKFYQDYFGIELDRQNQIHSVTMSWFPMDMKAYGSGVTLIEGDGYTPSMDGVLMYFTSPEETIQASVARAQAQGIEVLLPYQDISPHGYMAILADSEGNRFAIHSMKGE